MKAFFKKISLLFSAAVSSALAFPFTALADLTDAPPTGNLSVDSLIPLFEKILDIAWGVFVALSVAMFLWAAFLFITAQGDPGQLGSARKAVIWGIVGLVVAFFAFSIVGIIKTLLGS